MLCKKASLRAAFCILAAFLIGCATAGKRPWEQTSPAEIKKQWEQKSPEERALFFMSAYNRAYDDYMMQAGRPDLTDAQKTVLRAKKRILTEMKPLISMYRDYVLTGVIPFGTTIQRLERKIFALIDRLAAEVYP